MVQLHSGVLASIRASLHTSLVSLHRLTRLTSEKTLDPRMHGARVFLKGASWVRKGRDRLLGEAVSDTEMGALTEPFTRCSAF